MTEVTSSFTSLFVSPPRSSAAAANTMTAAHSTAMIQNMMCQFAWSMMMPATVGPAAGANAMTMPNTPMAVGT